MASFLAYSKYYDLFYREKDYAKESDYVIEKISEYYPGFNQLLELGCGSGAHARYLGAKGITVTGIELSPDMVEIAISKTIPGFTPIVGNIASYELNKQFDAVVSLFHVISYLTDNAALVSCFEHTWQHLKKDGIFLFDVWYSPAVHEQKPETRVKRLENEELAITRIAESTIQSDENVVMVDYEVSIKNKETLTVETFTERHPMRHFSIPEIKLLAIHTGFEVVCVEEFMTSATPGENTWGVCFILKKVSL